MKIVKSYLTHYQNANDGFHGGEYKTRQSSYSNALPDISMARVPTETELLDPSTALQRRLLCNPGVTDMIRVEILSLYAIQQHLGALDSKPSIVFSEINPHALSIIKENALEDLVIGVQSHFLQLSQFQEANLLDFQNLTKSNEQKTKARILFDRIKASNSPVSEVEMVLIPQLRKYLELSRSEAWQTMAWGGGGNTGVDGWIKRLNENDPSFTSLHILSFRRVTSAELGRLFDALQHNTALKEFYASGHSIDIDAARKLTLALEQNSTLERLNIGNDRMGTNAQIVEALAEGLAKNKGLVRLDLENKGLGDHIGQDDGAGSVKALAMSLEKNAALQELNLARNKLTDQDIDILCSALVKNKELKVLDLSLNSFGEQGARSIASLLADTTENNAGLREIDLSDNELTEQGGIAITGALKSNKALQKLRMSSSMDPPLPVEEGDEDKIQWDHDIEALNKPLSVDQVAEILSDGDAVLEALSDSLKYNSTLQEIWMDYCNITSVGISYLADALRSNQGLTTVRMRNNRIGNRGARAFGAALTPTIGGVRYNTTLKNLELGSNKVGVLGWHGLVGASSLESLGLFDNGIHVLHEAIESHLLQSSSTPTTPSTTTTTPPLSASIPNGASTAYNVLQKLAHLDLGCNGISREHFIQFGVCLIKGALPSLIRLEIAGNGERSQAPQVPDHDHEDEDNEDPQPDDEQAAWQRIVDRIEEARPGLVIHWKGAGAMQQA
ncbi:Leucine-rich repeat-containing protein 34 [Linnemannia zychae]|nr:Leucine-rich repeat-containing protein 34 [Linnemannia zychae]